MFFIVLSSGYDEPSLIGPFETRDDALAAYRRRLIESGADIGKDETAEALYFNDDAVQIGKVESSK